MGNVGPRQRVRQRRPGALSTECLLQKNGDFVGGALGSYEVMKSKLHRCLDYVVVPPAVWDILFEIYGGGPPLPRMIEIPMDRERASQNYVASIDRNRVVPIPESLKVVTHPWILHCQVNFPNVHGCCPWSYMRSLLKYFLFPICAGVRPSPAIPSGRCWIKHNKSNGHPGSAVLEIFRRDRA